MLAAKPSPVGAVFGMLTVLAVEPKRSPSQKSNRWRCRCSCGVECVRWEGEVKKLPLARRAPSGEMVPVSCGCNLALPDLTGQRFGKLLVQSMDKGAGPEGRVAVCSCDCGRSTRVYVSSLTSARSVRSCGCIRGRRGDVGGIGTRPARAGKSSAKIPPKRIEKVLALYAAGASEAEIIRRTKVSSESIHNLRRRAGLPSKLDVRRTARQPEEDARAARRAEREAARNLTGQRNNLLVVIDQSAYRLPEGTADIAVRCRCDCGREVTVRKANFRTGRVRSCGCLSTSGKVQGIGSRPRRARSRRS